jgi:hypothetical protein
VVLTTTTLDPETPAGDTVGTLFINHQTSIRKEDLNPGTSGDYPDTPLGHIREKSPHQSNKGFLHGKLIPTKREGNTSANDSLGVIP